MQQLAAVAAPARLPAAPGAGSPAQHEGGSEAQAALPLAIEPRIAAAQVERVAARQAQLRLGPFQGAPSLAAHAPGALELHLVHRGEGAEVLLLA